MVEREAVVRAAARRHGFSESAIDVLWDALARGRGQAQFSHPELGGMGQWSGGMLQIGDMFNAGLKGRVAAACADLAAQLGEGRGETATVSDLSQTQRQGTRASEAAVGAERQRTSVPRTGFAASGGLDHNRASDPVGWWPGRYGIPASSGSQNGMRYAYFPDRKRLVVDRQGHVTIHDTRHHRLFGVSQAQSSDQSLIFTSQHGSFGLESLLEVES